VAVKHQSSPSSSDHFVLASIYLFNCTADSARFFSVETQRDDVASKPKPKHTDVDDFSMEFHQAGFAD